MGKGHPSEAGFCPPSARPRRSGVAVDLVSVDVLNKMASPGAAELLLRMASQEVPASPVRPRRRSSAAHGLSHSASGAGRDATPTGIYSSPVSGSKRLRSETDTSPRANDNSPGASPSFDNVEAAAFAVAALSAVKVGALLSTPGSPMSPRRRSSGRRNNNNLSRQRHSRVLRSSPRRMATLRSPIDADESGDRQDADSNADDALSDDGSYDDCDESASAAMMNDGLAHEVESPLHYTVWPRRGAGRRGTAVAAAVAAAATDNVAGETSPSTRRGPRRASFGGREFALPRRPPSLTCNVPCPSCSPRRCRPRRRCTLGRWGGVRLRGRGGRGGRC